MKEIYTHLVFMKENIYLETDDILVLFYLLLNIL